MFCSNCGAQLGAGNFCPSCGSPRAAQPVAPAPTYAPAPSSWDAGPSAQGGYGYQPQAAYATDVNPKGASIFKLLSRIAAGLLALGFLMIMLNPLAFPGSELEDFFSFNTFALLMLTIAAAFAAFLPSPTWGKWLAIAILSTAYWLIVRPLVVFISDSSSFDLATYEFSSPAQLLFESFEYFELYLEFGGPVWVTLFFGSLVLMQIAPTLATIATLGSTIVNKRLS